MLTALTDRDPAPLPVPALLAAAAVAAHRNVVAMDTAVITADLIHDDTYTLDPADHCSCDGLRCAEEGCLDGLALATWRGLYSYDMVFPLVGSYAPDAARVTVWLSDAFTQEISVEDPDAIDASLLVEETTTIEMLDEPATEVEILALNGTWRIARDADGRPVAAVMSGQYEVEVDITDDDVDEHLVA